MAIIKKKTIEISCRCIKENGNGVGSKCFNNT